MSRKKMSEQASFIKKQERRQVLNKEVKSTQPSVNTKGYIGKTKFKRPVGNWTGKEKEYIDAVWKANAEYITSKGLNEKKFKMRVKFIMEEDGLSARKALAEYGRTRQFMSREEIGMENIRKNMTTEQAKAINKLMERDQRRKVDYEDFHWDINRKMWVNSTETIGLEYCYPDDSLTESIVKTVKL